MKRILSGPCGACFIPIYLSVFGIVQADSGFDNPPKQIGISLDWYQHKLDLDITGLKADLPGVPPGLLNSAKNDLYSRSDVKTLNLQLDYQIRPNINIFGAIGKVEDKTTVDFSSLPLSLPDLKVNNDGTAYTLGATYTKQYGSWLPSLEFFHGRISRGTGDNIKVTGVIPKVGYRTTWGKLHTGLLYQNVTANYTGNFEASGIPDVTVEVETENKNKLQLMAGFSTEITKNMILDTSIGVNGEQQFRINIKKLF